MSDHQKVSWLLPVKNAMPHLLECLQSIQEQTYQNFVVLACDNGSNDGSFELLNEWIPKRLAGKVYQRTDLELGGVLAFLTEKSETELCARIDADDRNYPKRLATQLEYLRQYPKIDILGSQVDRIDQDGQMLSESGSVFLNDADLKWRLRFANCFIHPSVIFKKTKIIQAGNYSQMGKGQDYDLWIRASRLLSFANIDQKLIKNRLWTGQVTVKNKKSGVDFNQELVSRYREILYPGIKDHDFERINEVFVRDFNLARLKDLFAIRRVAKTIAKNINLPKQYFSNSSFCRFQQKRVLRSLLNV